MPSKVSLVWSPACINQETQTAHHTLLWNSFLRDMNILQPKQAPPYSGTDSHDNSSLARLISGLTKGSVVQDMESWSQKSYSLKQCHRPFLRSFILQIGTWIIWLKIKVKIIPLKYTKATWLLHFKWSARRKLKSLSLLSGYLASTGCAQREELKQRSRLLADPHQVCLWMR